MGVPRSRLPRVTVLPDSPPDGQRVFEGDDDERLLALALETAVQDMSPVGDDEMAKRLAGYTLGEEPPPAEAPEYVELEDGQLELSNPPFLLATIEVRSDGQEYVLEVGFDSELKLLIDPPVEVTITGAFEEVIETLEQTLAEIYRTKGRRLEQIDEGIVEPD